MESSKSTAPNLRNQQNPTTMRLIDHQLNPILSPVLAWFGGGAKGPSAAQKKAATAQTAAAETRAAEQSAMMKEQMRVQAEQAAAQKAAQEKQLEQMRVEREAALAEQKRLAEMSQASIEANRPSPGAQVDANAPDDQAAAVQRRKGMRKSILAGESNQSGYDPNRQSTLG